MYCKRVWSRMSGRCRSAGPVVRSGWSGRLRVCWNPETGIWEVERIRPDQHCLACKGATEFRWVRKDALQRTRIRELNDRFRTEGRGQGTLLVTSGVQAMGEDFVRKAVDAVRRFDGFTADNDPWAEHDFGVVEIDGERVFWKIDAYDQTLTMGSPNPGNEALTTRILTIMKASEY